MTGVEEPVTDYFICGRPMSYWEHKLAAAEATTRSVEAEVDGRDEEAKRCREEAERHTKIAEKLRFAL